MAKVLAEHGRFLYARPPSRKSLGDHSDVNKRQHDLDGMPIFRVQRTFGHGTDIENNESCSTEVRFAVGINTACVEFALNW